MSKVVFITGNSRGLGKAMKRAFDAHGDAAWGSSHAFPLPDNYTPDVLILNAAIYGPIGKFADNSLDEWRACVTNNLFGAAETVHRFLPHMKAGSRIIFIGGGGGKPLPNFSAYAASKAALIRFAQTLAEELKPAIAVNVIAPGLMKTGLTEKVLQAGVEAAGAAAYQQALDAVADYDRPVRLALWLAHRADLGITGRVISARHDDWENLSP